MLRNLNHILLLACLGCTGITAFPQLPAGDATQLLNKVDIFSKGKLLNFNGGRVDAEYMILRDTSGISAFFRNDKNIATYNIGYNLSVAQLPFDVSLRGNNGIYDWAHTSLENIYQFNFDHSAYTDLLRSKVLEKIKPEAVFNVITGRLTKIRQQYEQSLMKEIAQIQQEFKGKSGDELSLPAGLTDLSANDLNAVKTQLMPEKDIQDVKQFEVREKIYNKIAEWKKKFEDNKTVKELKDYLPLTPASFKSFISNPANLESIVKQHTSLSSIQRLFMNITKLDLGQNAVEGRALSINQLVNTGINTEFKSKKSSFGFIHGINNNINPWLQSGLNSFVTNEYSRLTGFKIGTGYGSALDQSVSVQFFDFINTPEQANRLAMETGYLPQPQRQDAVITLHSGLPVNDKHSITVDVSKSIGSYTNMLAADSSTDHTKASGDLLGGKGRGNYAMVIDYSGEVVETSIQAYFKKVGLGYNNPGNSFLRRGETQFGLGVKRKLFKQAFSIGYKIDFRSQVFDPSNQYRYHALTNKLQIGYRFSRYTRIGLSYQRSDQRYTNFDIKSSNGANSRLQADGAYRIKWNRQAILNNFTLSHQRFVIPMPGQATYNNSSLLFSHTSSAAIDRNIIMLSLMGNYSDNKDYYFNTSFLTAEANYSFALNDKLRLGTGAGFYSNSGWNKQVGIRQQLSTTLFKKLNIDLDLSYKKAVQIIRPELADQLFMTTSLHYQF